MIRNPALISGIFDSCTVELRQLSERQDLSSYLDVNQLLAKSILLSCASFYEDEIVRIVRQIVEAGNQPTCVQGWLYSVAVEGQFYKWFDFRTAKNTNPFLSKFGAQFKVDMRRLIDAKLTRKKAERDFLDLCQRRNESVHRNYAAYSLDLTIQEIYAKHRSAMSFVRIVDYGARTWLVAPPRAALAE